MFTIFFVLVDAFLQIFFFYPFVFQLHVFHKRVFFSMLIRVYRLDLRQRVFFFPKLSYDDLHFFDEKSKHFIDNVPTQAQAVPEIL